MEGPRQNKGSGQTNIISTTTTLIVLHFLLFSRTRQNWVRTTLVQDSGSSILCIPINRHGVPAPFLLSLVGF